MPDKESAGTAGEALKTPATKGVARTKAATDKAARAAKQSATKAAGTVRAAKAARQGRVRDARQMASEAQLGEGVADRAIAQAEALHYEVVVNKRGLSVSALTDTLNVRWENGWRVAHVFEQRGNTVVVFEKRET